ncbi:hypothetical protein [Marinobacter shengliensis]|uniref:Uncharacterized protein n=1 Tax=Marinobacter shengliensis TaxID=1389223 RepID=A0ABV4W3A8_9GAMM
MDIRFKEGLSLQEAVAEAREKARRVKEEGVDQTALDTAAAKGFGNALFEFDEDEISQVVEEFYPVAAGEDLLGNSSVVSNLKRGLDSTKSANG